MKKNFDNVITDYPVCIKCGRKLKTAEARSRGMGSICYNKYRHDEKKRLFKLYSNAKQSGT